MKETDNCICLRTIYPAHNLDHNNNNNNRHYYACVGLYIAIMRSRLRHAYISYILKGLKSHISAYSCAFQADIYIACRVNGSVRSMLLQKKYLLFYKCDCASLRPLTLQQMG